MLTHDCISTVGYICQHRLSSQRTSTPFVPASLPPPSKHLSPCTGSGKVGAIRFDATRTSRLTPGAPRCWSQPSKQRYAPLNQPAAARNYLAVVPFTQVKSASSVQPAFSPRKSRSTPKNSALSSHVDSAKQAADASVWRVSKSICRRTAHSRLGLRRICRRHGSTGRAPGQTVASCLRSVACLMRQRE